MSTAAPEASGHNLPTRADFEIMISEYRNGLAKSKQSKALIDRNMYETIRFILQNPKFIHIENAQFRHWARHTFVLDKYDQSTLLRIRDKKRVAILEDMYSILCRSHAGTNHGGRDKTANAISAIYSMIPKKVVANFIQDCPGCKTSREMFKHSFKIGVKKVAKQKNISPDFAKGLTAFTVQPLLPQPIQPIQPNQQEGHTHDICPHTFDSQLQFPYFELFTPQLSSTSSVSDSSSTSTPLSASSVSPPLLALFSPLMDSLPLLSNDTQQPTVVQKIPQYDFTFDLLADDFFDMKTLAPIEIYF